MTAASSTPTQEQWKRIQNALVFASSDVVLDIDGYRVALQVVYIKALRMNIAVYVDGFFKGEWIMNDCEERRRFLRPVQLRMYSQARKFGIIKRLGKRMAEKCFPEMDRKHVFFTQLWPSFLPLTRHLLKNNASIRLAKINGIEEVEPGVAP